MALTKVGGGIIQQPIDVGIITATSVNASGVITATSFDGNVTGDVTGNVTGNLTGNVTGNVTGNLTGDVTGNTSGTAGGLTGTPNITVGSVTATTGNFSGNLDVGGVLTYEDVTNVDAVGIVTARIGVKASNIQIGVTGGTEIDTTSGNLTLDSAGGTTTVDDYLTVTGGGNVSAGDWRFTGASNKHVTWDNSEGALEWEDDAKATFGFGNDLQIYHNGSNSYIDDSGTGALFVRGNYLAFAGINGEQLINAEQNAAVELFHDGTKKFETTTTGATVTGTLVSELDLNAISSSISDTAVDVFVYDTRKDSDGGAWRKRTQHTSWYNETLGTATRGSRREFPAVAVIVAENDTLTIYDGDDPDLPMWMVFNAGNANGNNMIGRTNENTTCTSMLNGLLCVGRDHFGFHMINFIADRARFKEAGYDTPYTLPIGTNRNGGNTWLGANVDGNDIVDDLVNDVAMTVLPNAPIDDATGLPVPTIAVATNRGISVIKDDGTVSSKTITGGIVNHYIDFLDNGNIVVEQGYQYTTVLLDYNAESQAYTSSLSNSEQYTHLDSGWEELRFPHLTVAGSGVSGNYKLTSFKNNFASAHSGGLVLVDRNAQSPSNGLIAGLTTSYNTGWMHGDCKGAFLADTDTTNATVGSAHYTETFTGSGDNSWNVAGSATISGGVLTLANAQDSRATDLTATSSLTTGQKYIAEIEIVSNTSQIFQLDDDGAGAGQGSVTSYGSCASGQTGTFLIAFTKTGSPRMRFLRLSGGPATITSFKIYTAEERDRSANNTGLKVFGTVTKSAVATGADLVAYSGFSGSNVLYQPYNSDLDPGTGDYSFMCWFKCSSTSGEQILMRRFSSSSVTGGMMMRIVSSSSVLQWYVRDTSSNATSMNSTMTLDDGNWHCAVGTRQGSNAKLYIDGKLNRDSTCSVNSHNPGTDANLVIGAEETVGSPGTFANPANVSSLALVRYSRSAPSAEQVKKMYEDEKMLFQENAKATLYGSSDAVTALGYDEDTELLHVGTSAGRSDFQGLRRINNTTTAVTTAISASDELIVEQ